MIICDYREPENYRLLCDKTAILPCDYFVCGGGKIVRVERKTATDLWQSLHSERLNQQLVEFRDLVLLIEIEARLPKDIFKKLSSEKLLDIISGISVHHPIALSTGLEHTIRILRRIEQKLIKGTFGVLEVRPMKIANHTIPQVAVLSQLPGIGIELAHRIISKYKSLDKSFSCLERWSTEVEGIGKKKLENVRKTFYSEVQL